MRFEPMTSAILLQCSIVHHCGDGLKSCTGLKNFFSGLIFTTAHLVFITVKIAFILTSLSTVQIDDFHIFTVAISAFVWNFCVSHGIIFM